MSYYSIDFKLPSGDRTYRREALISCFLRENAGTGNDDKASRYRYNVETYGDYNIFLKRPTQLNKGFDFTVHIQGVYFKKNRRYSNPSHQDIFDALKCCKENAPDVYDTVRRALRGIYRCEEVDLAGVKGGFYDYEGKKHPIQIILLAIKWLFMEQDCAYWNYSGRAMLFDALAKQDLT